MLKETDHEEVPCECVNSSGSGYISTGSGYMPWKGLC